MVPGRKSLRRLAACSLCLFMPLWIAWISTARAAGTGKKIIDAFDYADAAEAGAAWVPGAGSPTPAVAESGAWGTGRLTAFPCDFTAPGRERCYWDRSVSLDLTGHTSFALRVHCADRLPISTITLYFRSGDGWYGASASLTEQGWNTLVFSRGDFAPEGSPAGWGAIDGIRLSPWRGAEKDTVLHADLLEAFTPPLLVVRPTRTAAAYGENVDAYCAPFLNWLPLYGVDVGFITDEDVDAGLLANAALVVLPYNPVTPALEIERIRAFVQGGGKLFLCYEADGALTDLLGIRQIGYRATPVCSMRFRTATVAGLPARAAQASWNYIRVRPSSETTRVSALWEDCDGNPLADPALLTAPTGAYLSHVLLEDDPVNKQQMLLAVVGDLVPGLKRKLAAAAVNRIGRVGLYGGYAEAVAELRTKGAASLHPGKVKADLDRADEERNEAKASFDAGDHAGTLAPAFAARKWIETAFTLCQLPMAGEFRAAWNHSGTGAYPGEWGRSADQLAKDGFTAILPNMLWGGVAHYPSKYLPESDTYRTYGDQIAQCVAACKPLGIRVHVWKVNWNLGTAPKAFIDRMRSRGRTQVDAWGRDVDWLCPSDPRNRRLELESLLEVVSNYGVDGIHFDYIRYPDDSTCYCAGCRARFETFRGAAVSNWPDDCYSGALRAEYRTWRCMQITALVRQVHERVKVLKPEVKISAAVFSDYPGCRDSVGQDWVRWIDKGYLDFVCPMDYTTDSRRFAAMVAAQMSLVKGRVPVYPGIGASLGLGIDGIIVQILETRRRETGGFTLFNYDAALSAGVLDLLGEGITHPEAP